MSQIGKIEKKTDTRFLNFYEFEAVHRDGKAVPYYVASRAKEIGQLKAVTHENRPDGVILYGVYGEQRDRVVLIRQYRYPVGGYVYEFPAGLVEPGEDMLAAGIREMYEETGLTFTPLEAGSCSRPFFTTVGMTDESCGTVFGYCSGEPTSVHQEASEEIQVILADRAECKRILREENVAIMCAYMLMHFIASEGDPLKFLEESQMKPEIRDMGPEDADGKGYVHWKSWQETYSGLIPEASLTKRTLERCQDVARRWPENTLVAELGEKIVGFACYGLCRDEDSSDRGEVIALYVLQEAQGLGIGKALMEAALEKLSAYNTIAIWVLKGNEQAIGFYEHFGFRFDGAAQEIEVGTVLRMIYRRP